MRTQQGTTKHYQIGREGKKWLVVGAAASPETFSGLPALLAHYQKDASGMPQPLGNPALREQSSGSGPSTNEGTYASIAPDATPSFSGAVHSVSVPTPLGLSFKGDDGGIFVVTKVKPESNSAASGKVKVGYHIVSVNGTAVQGKQREDVTALIKASQGTCKLQLRNILAVANPPKVRKKSKAPAAKTTKPAAPAEAEAPPAVPPRSAAPAVKKKKNENHCQGFDSIAARVVVHEGRRIWIVCGYQDQS